MPNPSVPVQSARAWLWRLAVVAALVNCQRTPNEAPPAQGAVAEAARPADPTAAAAVERLDQIAVALEKLVAQAEQAHGDGQTLLRIQKEFEVVVADAVRDLGGAERGMTQDQRRAVQSYYGSKIGPLHSRLQVLLFPAGLVELPRGATPGLIPVAAAEANTPSALAEPPSAVAK